MSEEEIKDKLIKQARAEQEAKSAALIKAEQDRLEAGFSELKKIFPHLKQVCSGSCHCEVFGYEFYLRGPDSEGRYYLNKIGGDHFDVYPPTTVHRTNIYTEHDMAKLLHLWDRRLKSSLVYLENYLRCPKHYAKPYRYDELMRIRNKDKPTFPDNQAVPGGGCMLFLGASILLAIAGFVLV